MFRQLALGLLSLSLLTSAQLSSAEQDKLNLDDLYIGGGASHNRVDLETFGGDVESASGWQVFFGLMAGQKHGFDLAVELGYMSTNEFSDTDEKLAGVWVSGVATKQLNEIDPRFSLVTRAGVDFGDDDGPFMGLGAQMKVHPQIYIRTEYVAKDVTQSYQANAVFRF